MTPITRPTWPIFETAGCDSRFGMRCIVLRAGRTRLSRARPYNQRIQPRVSCGAKVKGWSLWEGLWATISKRRSLTT